MDTARRSRNKSDEKQPRIDANGREVRPFLPVHSRPFVVRRILGNSYDLECSTAKITTGRSPNQKEKKQARIDANGRESDRFFVSIRVHSWLENPREFCASLNVSTAKITAGRSLNPKGKKQPRIDANGRESDRFFVFIYVHSWLEGSSGICTILIVSTAKITARPSPDQKGRKRTANRH
jgi:hypothetical protein